MEEKNKSGTYQAKQSKRFLKPLIFVLSILIIILIFFGFRACSKSTRDIRLIKAAKAYYKKNSSVLPKEYGECSTLEVNELVSSELVSSKDYAKCDRENTYVKVCKLESDNYQYSPFIKCGDKYDTKYGKYKEGRESDIEEDISDIRFTFLPQIYTNKIKNYYPDNKTESYDVIEYYSKIPDKEHKYRDVDGVEGYKWYSTDSGTNYWNNGQFTSEKPDGYDTKGDEGIPVTYYSLSKPDEKDYRTIENATLYRSKQNTTARPFKYVCTDKKINGNVTSQIKCEERDTNTFKNTIGILYTCDGSTQVSQNTVCRGGQWSDWTTEACSKSTNVECESKNGYIYTDKVWKWYLEGDFRKYYPSGNASSKEENTYYTDCPKEGYIKDKKTKATVYKYFNLLDDTNDDTASWIIYEDKYMTDSELVKSLKEQDFKVKNLQDIAKNKDIKYTVKLEYRNRKK